MSAAPAADNCQLLTTTVVHWTITYSKNKKPQPPHAITKSRIVSMRLSSRVKDKVLDLQAARVAS
jgi:hypothetical protein